MQKAILVAYASNAGSTAEVARAVGDELGREGAQVDVRPIAELNGANISGYSAVVVGAPMILGWHRDAEHFVKANRQALSKMPTAFFATALRLTKPSGDAAAAAPVYIDPRLGRPPGKPGRLGLTERFSTLGHYLGPILKSAGGIRPVSVAFFGGKLDFGRLKFLQMLFVMLIVGAQPGDFRNWDAIRGWAKELPAKLQGM